MKSNDLSKILRLTADLLDLYDGRDLPYILDDLIKNKLQGTTQEGQARPRSYKGTAKEKAELADFAKWASQTPLREVESSIKSNDLFSTNESLRELAALLGLGIGGRQSRNALIQTLLSHLDRTRMHSVISKRNDQECRSGPELELTNSPSDPEGVRKPDKANETGDA